jgi:hypothetical protein
VRDNNKDNNFKVTRKNDGSRAKIQFKYVEKGQGVLVQVVHDGKGSSDLEVTGVFLNAHELSRRHVNAEAIRSRTGRKLVFVGLLVAIGLISALALVRNDLNLAVVAGVGCVYLLPIAWTLRSRVPRGLETLEGLLVESGPDYLKNIRAWGKRFMIRARPQSS